MGISNSRLAYADCFEILDRALADEKGIRIKFASKEQAKLFRLRLHNARKIDRRDNTEAYGENHQMAGKSLYDGLVARVREDKGVVWLRVERLDAQVFEIESLSESPEPPPLPPPPTQLEKVVQQMKRRV